VTAALVWFRRDLRLDDHAALHCALQAHERVYCAFIFDTDILDALPNLEDRRVEFILKSLADLDAELRRQNSVLIVRHGRAVEEIPALAAQLGVEAVYANRDYEPDARHRDAAVAARLKADHRDWQDCKDQVIFEFNEVLTGQGRPYSVFTPYRNAWLRRLSPTDYMPWPIESIAGRLAAPVAAPAGSWTLPSLAQLGFAMTDLDRLGVPTGSSGAKIQLQSFVERLDNYAATRDYPEKAATSHLSVHLRFGTLSIRTLVALARQRDGLGAQTWLSELIWREFYQMLAWHNPDMKRRAFRREFDSLSFDDEPGFFADWCVGRTGYPLVDAAMRQLLHTGFMHNRLRMVAASFLVKDLGVDWRRGEAWFATQLLDYDFAANAGNWQWCASVGCDAQPWFRIFNPVTQSEKFDRDGHFIRQWIPELVAVDDKHIHAPWRMNAFEQQLCGVKLGHDYPMPLVDHGKARTRTLDRYRSATAIRTNA
jgi:deoxyribodipyrimidine photo-lyase